MPRKNVINLTFLKKDAACKSRCDKTTLETSLRLCGAAASLEAAEPALALAVPEAAGGRLAIWTVCGGEWWRRRKGGG